MAQRRTPRSVQASETLPSKLHLAYAIAVVQSKPPDLSVKDYILHLREHLRPKSKVDIRAGPERHLNSASYWVERFHQADAARAKLETKVTEYEREIERLKSELRSIQSGSTTRPAAPMKRRKDEVPLGSSAPATKRRKIEHADSYASSVETVDDTLPENMESLSAVHEEGSKLTQHLYHAHKHYKGHSRGGHQLACHLVQAANCLAPLLTSACQRHHQRVGCAKSRPSGSNDSVPEPVLAAYDNELISTFEAAARIFMSLFFGLKKLNAETSTPEDRGAVTYSFVRMFSHVLDTLTQSSSSQAAEEAALTLAVNSRRQMTTRGSQKVFGRTNQDPLATRLLSNFLSNVLSAPSAGGSEPHHHHHHELAEGFLFVLFRRLGDRIFLCTFGHRKRASVADDIDAWADPDAEPPAPPDDEGGGGGGPPPATATATEDGGNREKQIEQRALAIELPLLVALLERGLAMARHHIAPLSSSSSSSSSAAAPSSSSRKQKQHGATTRAATATATTAFSVPKSSGTSGSSGSRPSPEALKAGLSLLARKKLERTLAHAIFFSGGGGDDDGDDDDEGAGEDEMSECLTMPVKQALMEVVAVGGSSARKQKTKKMSWERGDGEEEKDVKAWFVERVWGLVGWEAVLEMR
ncbi:phosphatidylethanolamine-binding protein pebp [Diplodia corticola]|uniref:Phosphatidylethanolamine-binding protein pebp n=1 Tax=Diplodia corticola TaxID=236234 RepID=A0A1J9QNK5_9PEZI|nr:phosphatidylethanolamine-binding protein pebp [Diplodia corticola]OJD30486.1 phosphatidylethanolamine-binding protein pebp [Diplodia corticola]